MTAPTEPGRHVAADGRIIYAWPAEGRYADLWRRMVQAFPHDTERVEVAALLERWQDEQDTLVSYTDDNGDWVDVEPDWNVLRRWLHPGRAS